MDVNDFILINLDTLTSSLMQDVKYTWKQFIPSERNSQIAWYRQHDAIDPIMSLVRQPSKTFGMILEKIINDRFNLTKITNQTYDSFSKIHNLNFEIKSARYWNRTFNCKWQHFQLNYEFDYALLAIVTFNDIIVYIISRTLLFSDEFRDRKIMRPQGRDANQGWWVNKNDIDKYLVRVNHISDIIKYHHSGGSVSNRE